jgi:acyl dehydratase
MNDQTSKTVIHYFDDITEGMSAEYSKIIVEKDVISFAEVTGDKKPIHLDVDMRLIQSLVSGLLMVCWWLV